MQVSDHDNSPRLTPWEFSLSGNWVLQFPGQLQQEKFWKKEVETLDEEKVINYESHPTALSMPLAVTNN